jgi:hypothetical protein
MLVDKDVFGAGAYIDGARSNPGSVSRDVVARDSPRLNDV